jgi:uncharacterized protein with NRDE domain
MCTLVMLRRSDHAWPIILGANRDEMADRPWRAPGRHWADRPEVLAGMDELSGGAWLGVNDWGVMAAVLNQPDTLGSAPGRRSRGELVLEALDHAEAGKSAEALADIEPRAYRGFHVVVADPRHAYWIRHPGEDAAPGQGIHLEPIPDGVSMFTAHDLNDTAQSPRMARYRHRFEAAVAPDPDAGEWSDWEALLAARDDATPGAGMTFALPSGFGTVSSCLMALPSRPTRLGEAPRAPVIRFAAGPPDTTAFEAIPVAAELS